MSDAEISLDHRQRSEFIRELVQAAPNKRSEQQNDAAETPRVIAQFWHDHQHLPADVEECIRSWAIWERRGFKHILFDALKAADLIGTTLGSRYRRAFERCYHPAMQADYFRLCYLKVHGGFYIDADDFCVCSDIDWLTEDGRLKLQPLCYDTSTSSMVEPAKFLCSGAFEPSWIFYFNNNPLIARPEHPVIERALKQSTHVLETADNRELPEIQSTTGPGNLTRSIFEIASTSIVDIENEVFVFRDWEAIAITRWPLSYRDDARNWRLSNQKRYL